MPRYGPFIHQVHIADGFADDCDELVHRCLQLKKLTYQGFCTIWKEMNMGCLYESRTLGAEVAELSEEVIHVGKHYMLKNTSNFEESVVGLFIVYALLNLQPYPGFAHLRLVPDDLPAVARVEHVARRDKRLDVLYVLAAVLVAGPVQYHAAEREHGMDLAVRKYLEGFTSIDKLGVRPKGVFYRQNEELDIMKELSNITKRYTQAKMAISETAQFDRNLRYIDENLMDDMQSSLKKIISGIYEDRYGSLGEESAEGERLVNSRRAIKDRAMKQDVEPVRHLENLDDRKSSTVTSESVKQEVAKSPKKKRGRKKKNEDKPSKKIKSDPDCDMDNRHRKRRLPISPRAIKQSRNFTVPDEDDHVPDSDDSDSNETEIGKETEDSTGFESTDTYKMMQVTNEKVERKKNEENLQNDEENTEDNAEEENEQELDIQIDTLPVLIRSEPRGYQIEIIDSFRDADVPEAPRPPIRHSYGRKPLTSLKKISLMQDVSIKKINDNKTADSVASTSDASEDVSSDAEEETKAKKANANVNKNTLVAKSKLDKRDCKRVHVKSKFKRLGMLPVANFEPPEELEADEVVEDAESEPQGNLELGLIEDQ